MNALRMAAASATARSCGVGEPAVRDAAVTGPVVCMAAQPAAAKAAQAARRSVVPGAHGICGQGDSQRARWVIRQYPRVLSSCDELRFNDPAQALAYLVLHLPDRYCRMFQVLERLLQGARLPLGRRRAFAAADSFAAIDIGAGPGPGIFAIRNFYAALAQYAATRDPQWPIATLGHANIVEG